MQILLKTNSFERTYLKETSKYHYYSSLELIYDIFVNYHFEDRSTELYLYQMLKDSGYSSIHNIPIPVLNSIVEHFLRNMEFYKVDYDKEKLTYLLLGAIKEERINLIIDDKLIKDLRVPLILSKKSTVTFFKRGKLQNISFKSL